MKCRIDVVGKKEWIDDNNLYNTRPSEVEIILYKDGEEYKNVTLSTNKNEWFRFPCLIARKNNAQRYVYTVDEAEIPAGYNKIIKGNNIINVLDAITINCVKIWEDNDDIEGLRPASVIVRLMQNGVEFDYVEVTSPTAPENRVEFGFGSVPFADPNGVRYEYTLMEDPVANYQAVYDGFTITNQLTIVP